MRIPGRRLPFADNSFDVTISNTVQEHVEPSAFWGEQKRVLKPDGVCLCLSARKGLHCQAPCLEMTKEEKEFWENIPEAESELEKIRSVSIPYDGGRIANLYGRKRFFRCYHRICSC